MENETVTNHRCHRTTAYPNRDAFPGRYEPLELQRKVKTNTSFDILDDRSGSRTNMAKAKIIPNMPDEEFADTENVHKNTRNNQQVIKVKTKKNMTIDQEPKGKR